jgi:hypothetical protein
LPALLRRHHLLHPERIRRASRYLPVHYLLFRAFSCSEMKTDRDGLPKPYFVR